MTGQGAVPDVDLELVERLLLVDRRTAVDRIEMEVSS